MVSQERPWTKTEYGWRTKAICWPDGPEGEPLPAVAADVEIVPVTGAKGEVTIWIEQVPLQDGWFIGADERHGWDVGLARDWIHHWAREQHPEREED